MALEKKIQENFEEFMFYIDDTLDEIKQKASKQGYHLDMSLESLKDLAQFVRENDVKNDPENIDDFFKRHGKQSILIARLLPFISFDIVSYAAGLSSVSFLGFWVATGLGQLPATLVYSYVGGFLTGGAKLLVTGLLILFALAFLIGLGKQLYTERQKSKEKQNQNIG